MADQNYGPLWAFTDVEDLILAHYKKWLPQWISARERKMGIIPNTIARPRSFIVKQMFTALPGEEQTPLVIIVSDGFSSEPGRRGTGVWSAGMRVGIAVMCMGGGEGQARALCGHYQAALLGVALKHQVVDDDSQVHLSEFVNLRIEDIDEEAVGRSLAAVRMELVYTVNHFAEDVRPPDYVPDPITPDPDDPYVLTHHEEVIMMGDDPGNDLFGAEFDGAFR
jgi:hypothetical protein